MTKITGSCHCHAVTFSACSTLDHIILCNCSICAKKGMIHHQIAPEDFTLETGADDLALYQFNTKTAKHLFCKHCGIHIYSNPRSAPTEVSVNMRCVDGFDLDSFTGKIIRFDGIHWERELDKLKELKKLIAIPPHGG